MTRPAADAARSRPGAMTLAETGRDLFHGAERMTIYPPTIPQYHKYRISSFFRTYCARGRKAQMGCTPAYVAPQKLPSHWNEGKISPVVEHAKA